MSTAAFRQNERSWKDRKVSYTEKAEGKQNTFRRDFECWNPFLDFCYSQISSIEGKLWCYPMSRG